MYTHTLVFLDGPKPQDPPKFQTSKLRRRGACLSSVLDATFSPGAPGALRGKNVDVTCL